MFRSGIARSRWAAIGAAVAVSLGAGGLLVAQAAGSSNPAAFHALSPVRVFDTRDGSGGVPLAPVGPDSSIDVQMTGVNGVPENATAVQLNVTVVNGTTPSFLTVWPTGVTRPVASSLNWVDGVARPNAVTATIGTDGKVSFYNAFGTVDVLADLVGYYTAVDQPPFTAVVAQSVSSPALPSALGQIASVDLTLPDVCPGVADQWQVMVQADGYFLTGNAATANLQSATVALSLVPDNFENGTVLNQNFNFAGQYREAYSTQYVFTVDAGTTTFYEVGVTDHPNGVSAAQNSLIAESVAVTCPT